MIVIKSKIIFFTALSCMFICCSPIIFKPTIEDVDLAKKTWSDASIEQLNDGCSLYVAKCGGCHLLHTPNEFTEKQWIELLPEMTARAKLTTQQNDLVLKYVVTKSQTQLKKKSEKKL